MGGQGMYAVPDPKSGHKEGAPWMNRRQANHRRQVSRSLQNKYTEGAPATLLTVPSRERLEKKKPIFDNQTWMNSVIGKIFQEMDADGNGKVSMAELNQALRTSTEMQRLFGVQYLSGKGSGKGKCKGQAPPTPAFFANQIAKLDTDGDGKISFDEFRCYFFPEIPGCSDSVSAWAKLWTMFNRFDLDGNGQIEVDEFVAGLCDRRELSWLFGHELPSVLQDSELDSTLRGLAGKVDQNKDGLICWREFSAYFQDRCGLFSDCASI